MRAVRLLLALLLAAGGTGCGATNAARLDARVPKPRWPAPPLAPRIEWVGEVRNPEDFGIPKGLWRRIADTFTGGREQPLLRAYGVLADGRQRLVVVDTGAATVHVLDRANRRHTILGQEGPVRFRSPIGAAQDDAENLYLTDAGAGAVYRYDLRAAKLQLFTTAPLGRPTGIAYDRRNGLVFVSDTKAHQVVVFQRDGTERRRIGSRGAGPGQFNYPTDLHIDTKGQVYVTDSLNDRIQILTPEGQFVTQLGKTGDAAGYFAKPKGVAVDSDGHIYVVDALLDAVQIFDRSGQLLLVFGGHGGRPGEFWMPAGISIAPDDTVYVADAYNRRVQLFRYLKPPATRTPGSSGQTFSPEGRQ